MAATTDVPARYDLVLSGGSLSSPVGFVFLDALEPSLPFRTHRAIYGYSPTFVERQNVSGSFGDNQQDFFMTSAQKDWSEGEQQRYARVNDADSARRYWTGSTVNVSKPGQASMRPALNALTFGATVRGVASVSTALYAAGTTNLYSTTGASAPSDLGAHGLGVAPGLYGVVADGADVYLGAETATKIRRLHGGAFSDFAAATSAGSLAFLNNTLYGYRGTANGDLVRWDTAGAITSLYTWKGATGSAVVSDTRLLPFGGKLAIIRADFPPTIWIFDGTAPAIAATLDGAYLPGNGIVNAAVVLGQIFVGCLTDAGGYPAVYYYSAGTTGQLWRADSTHTEAPLVAPYGAGLVFTDRSANKIMYYNPASGGVSALADIDNAAYEMLYGTRNQLLLTKSSTAAKGLSGSDTTIAAATVTSSLFDFDSSLNKFFRGITVDFNPGTDGDGGSVDIAYRVNDVDGSYTTLQTGAVSGTEYILTGISGHSISVKVTLNKGTSTSGPVLKRVSVRAAPILTSYRTGEYVLDCTGDGGRSPRELRDRTPNPLSGFESLTQLQIAKASTTPLTITDRMGSYTGIVESVEAYEEHPGLDDPTRSGEFVVKLIVRGI